MTQEAETHATPAPHVPRTGCATRRRYERQILTDGLDSLSRIARLVPPSCTVLDLGTGPGALGEYLAREKQCTVDGVEIDRDAAALAAPHYRSLQVVDLETAELERLLPSHAYDVIVCADVLEHLRDPARLLGQLQALLKPDGRLLASVPNVAYAGLIAALLAGEFRYTREGLLDATHLRFFTRKSLLALLREHRFAPRRIDVVKLEPRETEFGSYLLNTLPPAIAEFLSSGPDAMAYQFVIEATLGPAEEPLHDEVQPRAELPSFSCCLYWRGETEAYAPDRTASAQGKVGLDRQIMSMGVPSAESEIAGLRFDICDRPGFVRLYGMRMLDASGACVWAWDGKATSLRSWPHHELTLAQAPLSGCVTLLASGDDPWLELPREAVDAANKGGALEVELGWPMSADYVTLAQEVASRVDARLVEMGAALTHARGESEGMRQQIRAAGEYSQRAEARIAELHGELERTRYALAQTQGALVAARAACEQAQRTSNELRDLRDRDLAAMADGQRRIDWLQHQIDKLRADSSEAAREAHRSMRELIQPLNRHLENAFRDLLASRPWRFGNCVAGIIRRASGKTDGEMHERAARAIAALHEASNIPVADLRSWLDEQERLFAELQLCASRVVDSRRYRLGRKLDRVAHLEMLGRRSDPVAQLAQGLAALGDQLTALRRRFSQERQPSV